MTTYLVRAVGSAALELLLAAMLIGLAWLGAHPFMIGFDRVVVP